MKKKPETNNSKLQKTSKKKTKKSNINASPKKSADGQFKKTNASKPNNKNPKDKELSKISTRLENEIKRRQIFQHKLIEGEERYRIFSQISLDYMFSGSVDKNGIIKIEWESPKFKKEIGYSLKNILSIVNPKKYFHQDDIRKVFDARRKVFNGEKIYIEFRIFDSNGNIVWIGLNTQPIYNKRSKKLERIFCAASNITSRKNFELDFLSINNQLEKRIGERTSQLEDAVLNLENQIIIRTNAEKELKKNELQIRELVENLDNKLKESEYKHLWNVLEQSEIATITINKAGQILNINSAFVNLTGFSANEITDLSSFIKLLSPTVDDSETIFRDISNSSKKENFENHYECTFTTKTKNKKDIIRFISSIYHEGVETGNYIIQFLDVTKQNKITSIINTIAEDISTKTGTPFFDSLVENISKFLEADFAFLGTIDNKNNNSLSTLSVFAEGKHINNFTYEIFGTPCKDVLGKSLHIFNKDVRSLYPLDSMLYDLDIEAYAGYPLFTSQGKSIGIFQLLKKSSFEDLELLKKILTIFGIRAATEIEKLETLSALKNSEEKFSKAFYNSPDLIFITRLDNALYLDVNSSFSRVTGYYKEEVIGNSIFDINILNNPRDLELFFREFKNNNAVTNYRTTFRLKDGTTRNCSLSSSTFETNNEKYIIFIIRDITEYIEREKQLAESEERYRFLIENSPLAHLVLLDGKVVFANSACVKMFKANSVNEIIEQDLFDFLHPDYVEQTRKKFKLINSGYTLLPRTEVKINTQDKQVIEVEASAISIMFNNKKSILIVANEITDKKVAQAKLKESELRYRRLFEQLPEAVHLSQNDKVILANKATLDLLGLSSFEELKTTSLEDYLHPDSKELYQKRKEQITNHVDSLPFTEYKIIRPNGSTAYVEISTTKTELHGNTVFQSLVRDITEKKISEAAIRESQERFKLVVDNSPLAIAIHQNGKIIYANLACCNLVAANTIDEIVGKPVLDFVHPDYKKLVLQRIKDAAVTFKPLPKAEEKLLKLNGEEVSVEITSSPFILNGAIAYQLILNDLSDYKKANEQLRKLSKAVDQSSAGVLITNADGVIEYVNKRFELITGYTYDEVIGQTPRIIHSGKQSKEFYSKLWNTILSGNNFYGDIINKRKNGELYWEYNSISGIKNSSGIITHFIAVKEDVTDQKKIENELKKAKEDAEEAAKVRAHILANMSHEFRTPLGSIIGYSSFLKDEISDPEIRPMIEKIEFSGNRLMKTLNAILSLTEFETDEFSVVPVECDLPFFCSQLKTLYEPAAKAKGLEFELKLYTTQLSIFVDENVLTQIIGYIIDNAIKFTKEGKVTVELDKPITKDGETYIGINVIDTGEGIKEEELAGIFKEFRQLSEGIRRNYEGLGLGLTLASRMAKLIDVEISVSSEINKGSTFSLLIPIKNKEQITESQHSIDAVTFYEENINFPLLNVLVVEDNPLSIEIVQKILSKICNVKAARDGKSALKLAEERGFDLFLIDINLGPGIDGIEVLNELRKMKNYTSAPAIALTAFASEMSKREFLQKGFNDFIAKPFEKRTLTDVIKRYNSIINKIAN